MKKKRKRQPKCHHSAGRCRCCSEQRQWPNLRRAGKRNQPTVFFVLEDVQRAAGSFQHRAARFGCSVKRKPFESTNKKQTADDDGKQTQRCFPYLSGKGSPGNHAVTVKLLASGNGPFWPHFVGQRHVMPLDRHTPVTQSSYWCHWSKVVLITDGNHLQRVLPLPLNNWWWPEIVHWTSTQQSNRGSKQERGTPSVKTPLRDLELLNTKWSTVYPICLYL